MVSFHSAPQQNLSSEICAAAVRHPTTHKCLARAKWENNYSVAMVLRSLFRYAGERYGAACIGDAFAGRWAEVLHRDFIYYDGQFRCIELVFYCVGRKLSWLWGLLQSLSSSPISQMPLGSVIY